MTSLCITGKLGYEETADAKDIATGGGKVDGSMVPLESVQGA